MLVFGSVLGFLIQPCSPSTLRKRRFRHQYYDLQISIFNFQGEIPSLLLCPSLISSLGSTIQFPRRSICSMESSFNLITTAAPVATLPHTPILFIPCQASLISTSLVSGHSSVTTAFVTCCPLLLSYCMYLQKVPWPPAQTPKWKFLICFRASGLWHL